MATIVTLETRDGTRASADALTLAVSFSVALIVIVIARLTQAMPLLQSWALKLAVEAIAGSEFR